MGRVGVWHVGLCSSHIDVVQVCQILELDRPVSAHPQQSGNPTYNGNDRGHYRNNNHPRYGAAVFFPHRIFGPGTENFRR